MKKLISYFTILLSILILTGCSNETKPNHSTSAPTKSANQIDAVQIEREKANAKHILAKAETGDAFAQVHAGWLYLEGKGVPQNDDEAFKWFKKAEAHNDPMIICEIARTFMGPPNLRRDHKKAFEYYKKAAELGSTEGMYQLGKYYESGMYVFQKGEFTPDDTRDKETKKKDLEKAEYWLAKAKKRAMSDLYEELQKADKGSEREKYIKETINFVNSTCGYFVKRTPVFDVH